MFPESDKPAPFDKEDAVVVLAEADVERIVTRLHQIVGPLPGGAAPASRSVAASPETARHCIRLGATALAVGLCAVLGSGCDSKGTAGGRKLVKVDGSSTVFPITETFP